MDIVGMVAMSHAPQWNLDFALVGPGGRYVAAVARARALVADLKPDVLVVFGPDHLRNFFFDAMPPFCIGAETVLGFGDYGSPKGQIAGAPDLGRFVSEHVMEQGFDPALSLRMGVDHGITQPFAALAPSVGTLLLPVMVSCGGAAMPSMRRCYKFGRAVGDALRDFPGEGRALVVGSGGLSHSPPWSAPYDPSVAPERRNYGINGRERVQEHNAALEQLLADRAASGFEGPINEEWDRSFLDRIVAGDVEPLVNLSTDDILRHAGTGGQEIRTWMAALGAWGGPVQTQDYEPVPTWITGMGCITAIEAHNT